MAGIILLCLVYWRYFWLIFCTYRHFCYNQLIDNCFQKFQVREHFCCDNESMFTTADNSYVVPTFPR